MRASDLRKALWRLAGVDPAGRRPASPRRGRGGLERVQRGTERGARQPWLHGAGVQGLGVARRITDGTLQRDVVLKVYVKEKLPRSRLDHPVPPTVRIPGFADPAPTDVEEIGGVRLESFASRDPRPTAPGVGVSHLALATGTLGCLVRRRGQPGPRILSSGHVLGTAEGARPGDPILQPGARDGGTADDLIATFEEAVRVLFTGEGYPNQVDAAIARVARPGDVRAAVKLVGVPTGVSSAIRAGMFVQKTGCATRYTVGVVKDPFFTVAFDYPRPDGSGARAGFWNQFLCTDFTDPGDSGALVMNMDREAVGLHFAGTATTSICNRIDAVLHELDLELVTHGE